MIWMIVLTLIFASNSQAFEHGCPPAEDVFPCVCHNNPSAYLTCVHIVNSDVLRNIFIRSSRYIYNTVRLENSVMQYLPSDMFQGVQVREFQLVNVTLFEIFDEIPENFQMLDALHIERTRVIRGVTWEYLRNMPNLRILNIYYNRVRVIDEKIEEYLTKNLKQLTFYETQTKSIKPGVLAEYKNLEKIAIESCELTELTRDMFPVPFNGQYLHFNYNKLKAIPDNLFNDMPNLHTVGLKGNMIATIPQFSSLKRVVHLLLEGNPMECDCRIHWMMKYKPEVVTGECQSPDSLRGVLLKDLDYREFNCPFHED